MHSDYNEAVFPVEESSTVVIKMLLVFQLKYSRELFILSKCFFLKKSKTKPQKSNKQANKKNPTQILLTGLTVFLKKVCFCWI